AQANAQSYFVNGNAKALGGSCYQLTSNSNFQLGSVWYADQLDLSKPFDLEFELNFGASDYGADGIVFVMQTVGNRALGQSGGGLGFEGFSPSLGVEFDDYYNANIGDPTYDHIAILKNGSVNHNSTNSIASPVPALFSSGNIEDGANHIVRIIWDPIFKRFEVWFDCVLRHRITLDLVDEIFNGQSKVFWGFTAATGGSTNTQIACLKDDIIVQDTFPICKGDTIPLNARESINQSYSWSPADFLDNTTIRTPRCNSIVPMTYYVEYKDRCNKTIRDTVHVVIDQPFTMDEGQDTLLCDNEAYFINLNEKYDSVLWNNTLSAKAVAWRTQGKYTLRVWKGVCYDDDTFNIRVDNSPTIEIIGDSLFCEGDETELSLIVNPVSASFQWQDGSDVLSKIFNETTDLSIRATNECADIEVPFAVREIVLPNLEIGTDSTLCEGDSIILRAPQQPNLDYLWNNGETGANLTINEPGSYSIVMSEADSCFAYDTIQFEGIPFPNLSDIDDIVLCKNEELLLTNADSYGEVIWNSKIKGDSYLLKNVEGLVEVKSSNQCGIDSIDFNIDLIDCFCTLYLPNALTVNNDGLNETLNPIFDCPKLITFKLEVYNKWGERLWETTDQNSEWDATFKGKPVQDGVYFWVAQWSGIENGLQQRSTDKGILHVFH
ncbi:MAG: hypothetical protein HKP14_09185, partial [Bacteroidia bacterium]|nr:hypothetical protein [Bacteroidia bacterium]